MPTRVKNEAVYLLYRQNKDKYYWNDLPMKLQHLLMILGLTFCSTACTNWIYRIDVPQGNFLDERDVEKLRVGMSKEQVIYVLGNPVVQDTFDSDTWYYVYDMKRGMAKRGPDFRKQMIINFENNKIVSVEGDFELSEEFNIPLDS
ncbi:hypothetical protein KUL49_19260 [Alteromonas sp. KUL49]|nr:hypothetical protein KUL49_19260 [Alteromonas sp. KUL49]